MSGPERGADRGGGDRADAFGCLHLPDLEIRFAGHLEHPGLEAEVRRLIDPASAETTVHWGRNYIYKATMNTPSGPMPVVVKQFRNQGWRRSLDRKFRGSKATRSWRMARVLIDAGLNTPEPLLLVESTEPRGNSHFVSALLEPAFEVRQFFRSLEEEVERPDFPEVADLDFLHRLGSFARSIHDAGIWYRDLSLGNVLAHPTDGGTLDLYLVDVNRARSVDRLGVCRRSRDICRFPILTVPHREAFLEGYWGFVPARWRLRRWLYTLSMRAYIAKHAIKNAVRGSKPTSAPPRGGIHHAHIPAAAEGASIRDRSVWDRLSDQPHQHASRWNKLWIRLGDAPDHLADFAAVVRFAPAVLRRYRFLARERYEKPSEFTGLGVAVRPCPEAEEDHFDALVDLGLRHVLLRLHPWEQVHDHEERLARRLVDAGFEVAFSLPQNRDLVTDMNRWRSAVESLADRFRPYGRHFIIGHAINRSKWGVWTSRESREMFAAAHDILRRDADIEVLGPGVIDFEFQATLAALVRQDPPFRFDAVASLLYVDRRGAPENPQMGMDTVDKVTLLKAICDVAPRAASRSWITEVNWPLWEGPHSPAGRAVSVDEESQADYLVRYYILALTTGFVERVYWWRLAARGYGLAALEADGSLRLRPSYRALKNLAKQTDGSTSLGPVVLGEGTRAYRFSASDSTRIVAWSISGEQRVTMPGRVLSVVNRDGQETEIGHNEGLVLGPSPLYCEIEA